MSKLRKTLQRQIIDALDASSFTSEDFDIVFGDTASEEYLISIIFKHNEEYKYLAAKNSVDTRNPYFVFKSPGQLEDSETSYIDNLHNLIYGISPWCDEIKNELKAAIPIFREMEELKNAFYEHLKGNSDAQEFTVVEINKLKERFDELSRRVDELEKNNVITESQSHNFKEGVNKITDDLEYYPKETWLKTSSNKIAKLIANLGKSPEGRKLIADSARKIIGLD